MSGEESRADDGGEGVAELLGDGDQLSESIKSSALWFFLVISSASFAWHRLQLGSDISSADRPRHASSTNIDGEERFRFAGVLGGAHSEESALPWSSMLGTAARDDEEKLHSPAAHRDEDRCACVSLSAPPRCACAEGALVEIFADRRFASKSCCRSAPADMLGDCASPRPSHMATWLFCAGHSSPIPDPR